jgi:uncharacterized membrane protein
MHKQIIVSGDAETLRRMGSELTALEGVVGLSLQRGVSLKPPGDVLIVHTLNQSADEVMHSAAEATRDGRVSVVISGANAFVSAAHHDRIARDDDEALWEEMESQLRNHGQVSVNYIVLMVLGGAVGAMGLTADTTTQAIAFVGASIISPGFEPIAKMSQGLVLGRWQLVTRGLGALLVGYGALVAAAALAFRLLVAAEVTDHAELGVLMIASLRDTYVVGPLMVLVLIPGSALFGAAFATGDLGLAGHALARVALDMLFVFVLGCAVFFWKQKSKHQRPLLP